MDICYGLPTNVASCGDGVRSLFVAAVHGGESGEEVLEGRGEFGKEVGLREEEGVAAAGVAR